MSASLIITLALVSGFVLILTVALVNAVTV
jgi:hypothetical protein